MKTIQKLATSFNLQSDELIASLMLFIYSFLIGTTKVFSLVSSQTIFLERYPAEDLSYVYILTALCSVLIGSVYLRISLKVSVASLVTGNLILMGLVTLMLRMLLDWIPERWPAMAIAVWYQIVFVQTNLAFWSVASSVLDIRQGKRLFSMISNGSTIAALLGGAISGILSRWAGVSNLLVLAGVSILLAAMFPLFLKKQIQNKKTTSSKKERTGSSVTHGYRIYILLIVVYYFSSNFLYTFVDNGFNAAAQIRYSAAELAAFFGYFSAVSAALALVIRSFVAGKLIQKFGVIVGIIAIPLSILGFMIPAVFGGELTGMLFAMMTLSKLSDKVFRGVQSSSMTTLFQPMMTLGERVHVLMRSMIEPLAIGSSGVCLWLLHNHVNPDLVDLAWFCVGFALLTIVACVMIQRNYVLILAQTVTRRHASLQGLSLNDSETIVLLEQELRSPNAENVVYALDMLEQMDSEKLPDYLSLLLAHPQTAVRQQVYDLIEKYHIESLWDLLEQQTRLETDETLQGVLLRVRCVLREEGMLTAIQCLHHESPLIRKWAVIGLLRSGSIEGIVHAGSFLMNDLESKSATDRARVAEILGESGITGFYRPILKLLNDPEAEVRKLALIAAGKLNNPLLWNSVIQNLAIPQLTGLATTVLIHAGEAACESLIERFSHDHNQPLMLSHLVRVAGLMHSERVTGFLAEKLYSEDEDIRHLILQALWKQRFQANPSQIVLIKNMIRDEIKDAAWTLGAIEDVHQEQDAWFLTEALTREVMSNRKHIFVLLSFILDVTLIRNIHDSYFHGDERKQAYALELLESQLPGELKEQLMPVLENKPLESILRQIRQQHHITSEGFQGRLETILTRSDQWTTTWTKCCVIYFVGKYQLSQLVQALASFLEHNHEEMLLETTLWAIHQLDPIHAAVFCHTDVVLQTPRLKLIAEQLEHGQSVLLTFEKIMELKQVPMFQHVTESNLLDVIHSLEELTYPEGVTLFNKGDEGDCLYIIRSGSVKIHEGPRLITTRTSTHLIGEFAVLSSIPRTASVTTLEPTSVFRLNQDSLFQLLTENMEAARGLIQSICKKLQQD
ncbi:MAG: cyclic nucleotide-binding domain-containing protein [SAR324 cluster bacterium]|nr:cyclic nucleotide-binding domain-containing protein [SAR324 cluster bacterium]